MNLERKLIKLLDQYIKGKKIAASAYEIKLKQTRMYEELIDILEGNYNKILENQGIILSLLNQLSNDNDVYPQFKNLISKVEDVKLYVDNIVAKYYQHLNEVQNHKLHIKENAQILESVHRIKNGLKYHKQFQFSEDIPNIVKALEELSKTQGITSKDIVLYLNMLEYHNEKIQSKIDIPEEREITEFKYNEIPNIVNAGFQVHDKIEVSLQNKVTLDFFALEIIEQIKNLDSSNTNQTLETNILDIITVYKNKKLPENEFNYIILKVLDEYLEELISIYQLLLDKDIYSNKENKEEVIDDYYKILNQYIIINNYYNKSTEYIPEEDTEDNEVEIQTIKKLIYSRSETNIHRTRLIHDLDNVPYEYYNTIYDLITRFKNGSLARSECKALKQLNKHMELRHDQVRIILKHVKDDIYNVLGVFTKKSDNDIHMYSRIVNRTIPQIDTEEKLTMQLELSEQTEKELETIVKDKGRKGTR